MEDTGFGPGDTSKSFSITTIDDSKPEVFKTVSREGWRGEWFDIIATVNDGASLGVDGDFSIIVVPQQIALSIRRLDSYEFSSKTTTRRTTPLPQQSHLPMKVEKFAPMSLLGVDAGTKLYWTLGGTGIDADDFSSGDLKGSRVVQSDGTLTFAHTLANDLTTEGTEKIAISSLVIGREPPSWRYCHCHH